MGDRKFFGVFRFSVIVSRCLGDEISCYSGSAIMNARKRFRPSITLSAGALTQLLAAFASFLAAFVLPNTFPEFQGTSSSVLVILGCIMLAIGSANLLFGRELGRVMSRFGKRSRVVVPREGIGFLAIMLTLAVGALMGHRNMPLLVFGMMAGPFILNGWIVYGMLKGVSVKRHAPRRAIAGEFFGVELEVSNDKRVMASHMLEIRDRITGKRLKGRRRDDEGVVTFVRVPAKQSRTGRYHVRFTQRGSYELGPVRVSSRFPMGIGERGQLFPSVSELIVHPQLGRLYPEWSRQQKELSESDHHTHSRPGFFDDDFLRIREYRAGDNPRSIHWRSTARRGELMIREHQQNRQSDSLVVLDLPELRSWPDAASEMAISLAATICEEQTRASSGTGYLLAIAADQPTVVSSRSPGGFREEALDALAVCNRSVRANLDDVLAAIVAGHTLHDDRIILITPRPAEAVEALVQASRLFTHDSIDLLHLTTVIEASIDGLQMVFQLEDLTTDVRQFPNAWPSAQLSSAVAGAVTTGSTMTASMSQASTAKVSK